MKTVLVLTDFSTNAMHAAEMAIQIADELNLNILLFNVYFSLPLIPASENDAWSKSYEIFKKESEEGLQNEVKRLYEIFETDRPGAVKPHIECLAAFGDLGDHINDLQDKKNIDFMVMGARKKQQSFLLFGDDINAVIKNAKKPVLIVNDVLNFKETKNIVLTAGVAGSDAKAIACLRSLSYQMKLKVHVAYTSPAENSGEKEKINALLEPLQHDKSENISFHHLKGENIVKELVAFNASIPADLLAIVHKKRSFLWDLFNESITEEFIATSQISILIIPELHVQ